MSQNVTISAKIASNHKQPSHRREDSKYDTLDSGNKYPIGEHDEILLKFSRITSQNRRTRVRMVPLLNMQSQNNVHMTISITSSVPQDESVHETPL